MEILDLENAYSLNNGLGHTSLCKFKRRFDLENVCNDFRFVNINIKGVPFIYGLNLEQYDIDVILNKLNFHLKIVCSTTKYDGFIRSLKIKIYNTNKQKEIASCTNYLQRQKNLHLALNVLRKCSKLFEDRKIVLQTISDVSPDTLIVTKTDDSGYSIQCVDKKRNFLFFESNWSVGWNYRNYDVFDFVDFMLNGKDKAFNMNVKSLMKNLTNPHNNINQKLLFWNKILHYVQECTNNKHIQESPYVSNEIQSNLPLNTSRRRYKNLLENKEFYLIHPEVIEIIDSDDEVSMEIEESDNDVEIVNRDLGSGKDSRQIQASQSIVIDDFSD